MKRRKSIPVPTQQPAVNDAPAAPGPAPAPTPVAPVAPVAPTHAKPKKTPAYTQPDHGDLAACGLAGLRPVFAEYPLSELMAGTRYNPRLMLRDVPALAQSIRDQGLTDPLTVARVAGDATNSLYVLRGNRRLSALHMVHTDKSVRIPCWDYGTLTDPQAHIVAIDHGSQSPLSKHEVLRAVFSLLDSGLSRRQITARMATSAELVSPLSSDNLTELCKVEHLPEKWLDTLCSIRKGWLAPMLSAYALPARLRPEAMAAWPGGPDAASPFRVADMGKLASAYAADGCQDGPALRAEEARLRSVVRSANKRPGEQEIAGLLSAGMPEAVQRLGRWLLAKCDSDGRRVQETAPFPELRALTWAEEASTRLPKETAELREQTRKACEAASMAAKTAEVERTAEIAREQPAGGGEQV